MDRFTVDTAKFLEKQLTKLASSIYKRVEKYDLQLWFTLTLIVLGVIAYFSSTGLNFIQQAGWYLGALIVQLTLWSATLFIFEESSLKPKKWADDSWWWTLDGWQFEREVGQVFKRLGYQVEVTRGSGDGGADIIMYKDNLKYVVQCKHYKKRLGPEAVRSLYGVREQFNADRLVMVASRGLTPASEEFIKRYKNVYKAYDLQDIIRMSQGWT